ncbi:hypothetical protein H1R20_g2046, partial [Candolleomyces eurysporus]
MYEVAVSFCHSKLPVKPFASSINHIAVALLCRLIECGVYTVLPILGFLLDNKDQWVILTPGFRSHSILHRIGPVRAGWGRPLSKAIQADELDPEASDGGGDPNKATDTITVLTKLVGALAAVGVEGGHLVTKNYPVIRSLHYRVPTWQFVPVNTN